MNTLRFTEGEKVLYNIFYDDYEDDPSEMDTGFTGINWPPDGMHPDAGKVLTVPIERFI